VPAHRIYARRLAIAALCILGMSIEAQSPATTIESDGEATVSAVPDEIGFRLDRRFTGPTLIDALKQVRSFERTIAQGIADLDLPSARQESASLTLTQSPIAIQAEVHVWLSALPAERNQSQTDALVDLAERMRKLGVTTTADVAFGGYAVRDPEPVEADAVARAAENALLLADVAGELAQRHVVDVENVRVVDTRWEGTEPTDDGHMPLPPAVACRAKVHIAYRYESAPRR